MSSQNTRTMPIALVLVLTLSANAWAQCDQWRPRAGLRVTGIVISSLTWDPDGAGGQPPMVVVGGSFDRAGGPGGIVAHNIAAWNGVEWSTFGEGLDGLIECLAVYNGQLYAGGHFPVSGGVTFNHIARWNGASWEPLENGLTHTTLYGGVSALTVYAGDLIVGGKFTHAGNVSASNVARWNGTTWNRVGDGTNGFVSSLAVYQNELVAGGVFDLAGGMPAENIARWDGTIWSRFDGGVQTDFIGVEALAVYAGELYAGGGFTSAGGQIAIGIARWDGTRWDEVAGGTNGIVGALRVYDGGLIAGGGFSSAGGVAVSNIARWNGTSWHALSSGTDDPVFSLSSFGGELCVGGMFKQAGPFTVDAFTRWDGAIWHDMSGVVLSSQGEVRALKPWSGRVVLGGSFTSTSRHQPITTRNLAAWDGLGLTDIGWPSGPVDALATAPGNPPFTTDLIIGGWFVRVDGADVNRIARLNDTLATGWRPMGAGFDGPVHAIEYFNGSIYAAGSFTMSGTTPVSYIARWTGSGWVPLGSGVNGRVWALKGYNGQLYVGGSFNFAGGILSGHLARWNPAGTGSWDWVGGTFTGTTVNALEIYNNELAIGGYFPGINSSPNLARWNGSMYSTFGVGGTNSVVRAITVSGDAMVIGGDFTQVGGITADHVARWNGSTWRSMRGGTNDTVYALTRFRNEVHVGGMFDAVRFGELPSERYARFSEDGVPWIAKQPDSLTVRCGRDADFHCPPAQGYGVDHVWRKDGSPLVPGATGTGSIITITDSALFVENVGPQDAGTYDCTISNACGSDSSQPATLTVIECCVGDLNDDGQITLQDLAILLSHFGTASGANYADGDLDDDGDVELQDLAILLAAFGSDCS